MKANLTIDEVAKFAGCHRNTVYVYEKEGFISPVRDRNNWRRYTMEQAKEVKKIYEIRIPAEN